MDVLDDRGGRVVEVVEVDDAVDDEESDLGGVEEVEVAVALVLLEVAEDCAVTGPAPHVVLRARAATQAWA